MRRPRFRFRFRPRTFMVGFFFQPLSVFGSSELTIGVGPFYLEVY